MPVDRIIWKIVFDCIVLICLGFPIIAIELWVWPYRRGFFADDQSIRLPYKRQSVPEKLALVAVGVLFITIIITEIVREKKSKEKNLKRICGRVIPSWVWNSYCALGVFLFGLVCQHLLVFTTKTVIGRLRPHFYDICMPEYNATAPLNVHGYIQEYECTRTPPALMKDAHRSFPSGHSGFSMYCAVFFIFYIQAKGTWRGSTLLRHTMQFLALLGAWYVGLTRVQEHYHFWSDVAAGYFIGAAFAILMFVYILKPGSGGASKAWDRDPAPQHTLPRPVLSR